MISHLVAPSPAPTLRLCLVAADRLQDWLGGETPFVRAWVEGAGLTAKPGEACPFPRVDGGLAGAVAVVETEALDGPSDLWQVASLARRLPQGRYGLDGEGMAARATRAALGWALGGYAFTRYRKPEREPAKLVWPASADRAAVERTTEAVFFVRDMVNTPAEEMGPAELAAAAKAIAEACGATYREIVGDDLLSQSYPLVHAVGRASVRAPRLIDIGWGDMAAPKVTLVGKGVCFDSGGLDLKGAENMKLMKKDMGGAAHALALGRMIMAAGLKVRLRVLVPAVENAVSGNAFRPLDVIRSRKGLTVEIGNTDAEGRLILADALAEACTEKPALVIDFATLTGAARVALGPEVPALFCNDDALAADLARHAGSEADPLWRLPLHRPYRARLDSRVADLNNTGEGPFAGSITAALFLAEFVEPKTPWAHIDLFAWNPKPGPGRPEGGEAQTLRAVFALLQERFASGG